MTNFRLYFQQVLIMVYYICTRTNMFFLWRAKCFRYLMLSLIYQERIFFYIIWHFIENTKEMSWASCG